MAFLANPLRYMSVTKHRYTCTKTHLTRGRHPDGTRPVVVQMAQLVGEPLYMVCLHAAAVIYDHIVSRGHSALEEHMFLMT
jgi:hypothetical protein